jgi:hypothetical protein
LAVALVDYFLRIDGVEGESQDAKHRNEIQVLSFDFGESQAGTFAFGGEIEHKMQNADGTLGASTRARYDLKQMQAK